MKVRVLFSRNDSGRHKMLSSRGLTAGTRKIHWVPRSSRGMTTWLVIFSLLIITLTAGITSLAWGAEPTPSAPMVPLDHIVAIVNNSIISENELNQQTQVIQQRLLAQHLSLPPAAELKKQVLNHLIDIKLQLQDAKQQDILISNSDVNQAIDEIATHNHLTTSQFRSQLEQSGIQYSQFRSQIRDDLIINQLQQQMVASKIVITDQEVTDVLEHLANGGSTQYQLEEVLIPLPRTPSSTQLQAAKAKANIIITKLHHGANFQTVAIAESSGPMALKGGDLGWRSLAELPTPIANKVQELKPGQISTPIYTSAGYHVLKLLAIRNNTTKMQRDELKQLIFKRKFEEGVLSWLQQLRSEAFIKIYD